MTADLRNRAEALLKRNPEETPVLATADVQKLVHEMQALQIELETQNKELRQAQHELAASHAAYVELFESAPIGYLTIDPEGRIRAANFTAANLLGIEHGKLLVGRSFADFIHNGSLNAWDRLRRHLEDHLEKHGVDLVLQRPDGGEFSARIECTPRLTDRREIDFYLMVLVDITPRVQAELALQSEQELSLLNLDQVCRFSERTAELRASEERFRTLFNESPDACFLIDLEGRVLEGNKTLEDLIGYPRKELVGMDIYDGGLLPAPSRAIARERMARLAQGERVEPTELSLRHKDGTETPVEITSMPLRIQGEVVVLGNARDLTARRQTENTLRESEKRFRTIFDQVPDGILLADPATRIFRMASQAFCTKMGYSEEEVLEMGSEGIHPAEDLPYVIDAFEKQARGEVEEVYDIPFLRRDGGIFYADMKAFPIFLDGKQYLLGHVRDVTERKRMKDALLESEEKYRMVFTSESDAIMIFDGETHQFIDVNDAALELYGYSRAEFLTLTHAAVSADPELAKKTIPATLAGARLSAIESYHRRKDGTIFPVEITSCSFVLQARRVICGVIRDITHRVAWEQELSNNREDLRKLASELSLAEQRERQRVAAELHDGVSQMLSSSCLRLSMLKENPLPAPVREALDTISEILAETLRQTRSLTFELSCPMLSELGLAAALEELCSSMTHEQAVRFKFKGSPEPLPLSTDRKIVLYRSARELLINVMKHSGAKRAWVELERQGDCVRIVVADDGRGFDASMAGKRFSPSGGFGLFNIREYLRHSGGELLIESGPGNGTQVAMTVPLEEEHA